jgi:hypothetical protein
MKKTLPPVNFGFRCLRPPPRPPFFPKNKKLPARPEAGEFIKIKIIHQPKIK